jgi:hypothetical protein
MFRHEAEVMPATGIYPSDLANPKTSLKNP